MVGFKGIRKKEKIEMCEAEKRWLEVKSKEWKAEGIELGIKQGIEQGSNWDKFFCTRL